eukprot:1049570-Lingulodinium_polyedra.AAC.1
MGGRRLMKQPPHGGRGNASGNEAGNRMVPSLAAGPPDTRSGGRQWPLQLLKGKQAGKGRTVR